jgi:para-nitrobenzyl esterase
MNFRRLLASCITVTSVLLAVPAAAPADDGPTVKVTGGTVAGSLADGIRSWKGVPFAAPPVGPLRWKPPAPVIAWTGMRDASTYGPRCVQPGPPTLAMSEDCLTLNVWSPSNARNLPVFVWIFGGGFVVGSGAEPMYDGAALAKRGLIVVTFNYRLNLLGFLAHPQLTAESPDHTSGNYGILDQLAVLKWVQANAVTLGGDPHNVTIAGESAGAASVNTLITMPSARGLFSRAIMQSAPVLRPELTLAQAEAFGQGLGDLAALRALPPQALLAKMPNLDPESRSTMALPTGPIVDGVVIPKGEREAYASKHINVVPIIIGNNTDEGRFWRSTVPVKTLAQWAPRLAERFGARADDAARLYPATDDASANHADTQLVGDGDLNWGVRELAREMSGLGAPVYRYLFAQERGGNQPGHTDELAYVFGHPALPYRDPVPPFTPDDQKVSDAMMTAWVSFATVGSPTVPGLGSWPPYTARNDTFVVFGSPTGTGQVATTGTGFRTAQLDFIGQTWRK